VGHGDLIAALADAEDGGAVGHVGDLRAGAAGGLLGEAVDVHVVGKRLALEVELEQLASSFEAWGLDEDLMRQPAGTQQGRIEDLDHVRRREDDDVVARGEAVELGEKLVERGLALLVADPDVAAAPAAYRVDLVDEDNPAGGACLAEQVPQALGAEADEHLDELRAGGLVDRQPGLAGQRAGKEGLAGARPA